MADLVNMKAFWYKEWKYAEKDGNIRYADSCKNKYKEVVLEEMEIEYLEYFEKLKMYPMINLN